jgi:hypothetical protein
LGNFKGRDHSENIVVDGRIILEWILRKQVFDWIHLVQDKDQWRAVMNTIMKSPVPQKVSNFFD